MENQLEGQSTKYCEMLTSLNLGIDSAVFLDDSPFERSRVREAFPTVFVPELPQDPLDLSQFVQTLRCFDNPVLSHEDRTRTALYVADRKRVATRTSSTSLREWLLDLGLRI
jgi:predicted enzyme involved in methoxymalonyl-ACP biosynthesis